MLPITFERVMMAELRNAGFTDAKAFPGKYIHPHPDMPITITDTSVAMPQDLYSLPNLARLMRNLKVLHGIAGEATWLFDNTPDLRGKDLHGEKQFASYMRTMLTARMTDDSEPEYAIRTREYDGSLFTNRRCGSYREAKVTFLILSSLAKNIPAFENRNLEQMHAALLYRGQHDEGMQPLEIERLNRAIEAMEFSFPGMAGDAQSAQPQAEWEQGQEP